MSYMKGCGPTSLAKELKKPAPKNDKKPASKFKNGFLAKK
jgi:hypothetical protein